MGSKPDGEEPFSDIHPSPAGPAPSERNHSFCFPILAFKAEISPFSFWTSSAALTCASTCLDQAESIFSVTSFLKASNLFISHCIVYVIHQNLGSLERGNLQLLCQQESRVGCEIEPGFFRGSPDFEPRDGFGLHPASRNTSGR